MNSKVRHGIGWKSLRSRHSAAPRRLRVEALETRQLLHSGAGVFTTPAAEGEGTPIADFSLTDANTTSPSGGQEVSPRDFLNQVSGWYFGSAL
jgi:hypothetical protein